MERELIIDRKFVPRIILKYKIKAMLKVWQKRSKKSKQRYFKLRQWSDTEQSYLQKLIFLRDKVRKPLLDNQLIQEDEQKLIFSNLQSMIQLSMEMKSKIANLIANWNPVTTLLAPTVQSLVIYLKIYKEYSNNYRKADALIQELKKSPKYKQVITIFNVEDYLIKPVQRPLQYKLFISDYIKLMPPYHADKENLEKALKVLLKIADQINQFVEKQMRAQIMVNLQNQFGDLIQSTRQYRTQFQAIHPDFNCKVYVFNDLLLIVKVLYNNQQQKFTYMHLCGASYVIRQEDCKTFKNRLYICGSYESIHLTMKDPDYANNVKNTLEQIIGALYQKQFNRFELLNQVKVKRETMVMNRHSVSNDYKWKQQYTYRMKLRIEVIGVEKRLYEKEWKIVYAVKFQLGRPETLYQILFYEIDDLKELQRYLKEVYSNLKIPSLDTKYRAMNYDDFRVDFTKYYEYKQILIEDFLNFCLRSKVICKKPEFIVFKLKMHECMWDYLNRFSLNCQCQSCNNSEIVLDLQSYQRQRQKIKSRKFQYCIINAFQCQNMLIESVKPADFKKLTLQQKLIYVNDRQKKVDYNLQNRGQFGKKIDFHVYVKLVGEQSQVLIEGATINDTCRQIIQQVCKQKGIQCTQDFVLVYVHGKYEFYLDGDEYIYDSVKHLQDDYKKVQSQKRLSLANRQSIFTGFSKSMDNYGQMLNDYSIPDQPKLYMRKVISLTVSLDQKACQANPERYPLVLGQMLRKFQEQFLLLSSEEVKIFCALFYGIEEYNTIVFSKNIFCNQEKLKKMLPQSKWGFLSSQFVNRVKQILEYQVKPSSSILLLYRAILVQYGQKQGWITQYFEVQSLDSQTLGVKEKDRHVFVGVNYQKVVVSRKFNAVNLLEFPILKFNYRTSGDTLWIVGEQKTYTFIGNSWLFFENLVQKYKIIQQMEVAHN